MSLDLAENNGGVRDHTFQIDILDADECHRDRDGHRYRSVDHKCLLQLYGDANDGDQTNNDFADLSAYYDNYFEAQADLDDDGLLNQSNATGSQGQVVEYNDNTALPGTITLTGATADDLNFDTVNLTCFVRGTLIRTAQGDIPIEDLTVGDHVETMDDGLQAIRWIGSRAVPAKGHFAPIRIKADVLGNTRDLLVSPQHLMLITHWRAELLFGEHEVLLRAAYLTGSDGIHADESLGAVEYFHLLFDSHEIIFAEGCPSESFHPGETGVTGMEEDTREELLTLFPELREKVFLDALPPAWPSLKRYEASLLAAG